MRKTRALTVVVSVLLVASAAHAGPAVPELDPSSASMGVALLVGGLLVLTGRRLKR